MDYNEEIKPIQPDDFKLNKVMREALIIAGIYGFSVFGANFLAATKCLILDNYSKEQIERDANNEDSFYNYNTAVKCLMHTPGKPGRDLAYMLFDKGNKNLK